MMLSFCLFCFFLMRKSSARHCDGPSAAPPGPAGLGGPRASRAPYTPVGPRALSQLDTCAICHPPEWPRVSMITNVSVSPVLHRPSKLREEKLPARQGPRSRNKTPFRGAMYVAALSAALPSSRARRDPRAGETVNYSPSHSTDFTQNRI